MIASRAVHRIRAPLASVERALLAPSTLPLLVAALPEVAAAEERGRREEGPRLWRRARFVARAAPPGIGRLLASERLEWIEEVRWDRARHAGDFRILPNLKPERAGWFRCEGTYRLERVPEGTARLVETELEIPVRLVGPTVERLVAHRLEPHMAVEARVLERLARGEVAP